MNERCLLVLVQKFYGDRWETARIVPRKGPEEYAVKATAEDLQQSAMYRCLHQSDGDDAVKSLRQHAVQKLRETVRPVDVIFEESGAAESQQLAIVERAIWEVQSTARTLVHACQEHHRLKLPLSRTVRIYAIEHAAQLLNSSQKAANGNRTAYELRWRTPYRRKLPPFIWSHCLSLPTFVVAMAFSIAGAKIVQLLGRRLAFSGPMGCCGFAHNVQRLEGSREVWAAWRGLFLPHREGNLRSYKGSGV